eukprot:40121_1
MYSQKDEIITQILMKMPEHVRWEAQKKLIGSNLALNANIYANALWVVYRIDQKNIDTIQRFLPSGFTVMKHKIFERDRKEDYYLCYNIYMSAFGPIEAIRLEINVIAANKNNKGCWVVLDYYTDAIRSYPISPLSPPNCKKKYFNVIDVNDKGNKKSISAAIYIDNQEKQHILFDFLVDIDLNDKPLIADTIWLTANDMMYSGGDDAEKLAKFGFRCQAEFDQREHENYLKGNVKRIVNNLFSDVRGELVTCFIIPNEQNYKIKFQ